MYQFIKTLQWNNLRDNYLNTKDKNQAKLDIKIAIAPHLDRFVNSIYPILASITPIITSDGSYSATKTFEAIPSTIKTPYIKLTKEEFRDYYSFIIQIPPSTYLGESMVKKPNYSSLVPYLLAAFKQEKNIPYEMWDFSDPNIDKTMHHSLRRLLPYRDVDFSAINLLDLRENATLVASTGNHKAPTAYPSGRRITIYEDIAIPSTHPLVLILTQLWCANVQYRSDLLVLDPNNWDNVPEPLDQGIPTKEAQVLKDIDFTLPF